MPSRNARTMTDFSGELDGAALPAIVRFFSGLDKTGCLHVVHGDWQGEVFFESGQVVDVRLGSRHGLSALDALVQVMPGASFNFDVLSRAQPGADMPLSADALQAHLDDLLRRMASGRVQLPSLDAVPAVIVQPDPGVGDEPLPLDRLTLLTLVAVDGQRTVREIVAVRGTIEALWQLGTLAEVGLIRVAVPPPPPASSANSARPASPAPSSGSPNTGSPAPAADLAAPGTGPAAPGTGPAAPGTRLVAPAADLAASGARPSGAVAGPVARGVDPASAGGSPVSGGATSGRASPASAALPGASGAGRGASGAGHGASGADPGASGAGHGASSGADPGASGAGPMTSGAGPGAWGAETMSSGARPAGSGAGPAELIAQVPQVDAPIRRPFLLDVQDEADHCPKLGFEDDPDNSFGRPTRLHRCFAAGIDAPLPLSIDQQRELCMSDQFVTCPRLMLPPTSTLGRPYGTSLGRPPSTTLGRGGRDTSDRPGATAADRSGASAADRSGASAADRSGASAADRSGATAADRSGASARDRPGPTSAGRPAPRDAGSPRSATPDDEPGVNTGRIVRLPFGRRGGAVSRGPAGDRQAIGASEVTQFRAPGAAPREGDAPGPTPRRVFADRERERDGAQGATTENPPAAGDSATTRGGRASPGAAGSAAYGGGPASPGSAGSAAYGGGSASPGSAGSAAYGGGPGSAGAPGSAAYDGAPGSTGSAGFGGSAGQTGLVGGEGYPDSAGAAGYGSARSARAAGPARSTGAAGSAGALGSAGRGSTAAASGYGGSAGRSPAAAAGSAERARSYNEDIAATKAALLDDSGRSRIFGVPVIVIAGIGVVFAVLAVVIYLLVPFLNDVFSAETPDPSLLPNSSAVAAGESISRVLTPRATPTGRATPGTLATPGAATAPGAGTAPGTNAATAPGPNAATAPGPNAATAPGANAATAPGANAAAAAAGANPAVAGVNATATSPNSASSPASAAPSLVAAATPQPAQPTQQARPSQPDQPTQPSQPATPAQPAPDAALAPGTLVNETFANNALNWPSSQQGNAWVTIGGYRLIPRQAKQFVAIAAPLPDLPEDVIVNATFRKLGGPPGGGYGIILRDQGDVPLDGISQAGRYYILEVGDKGEIGIWRRDGDHWVDLLPWQHADAVRTGAATNELTVSAIGDRLSLSVNGVEVATHTDATLPTGGAGLFAGGDDNQVVVEHFSVRTP